jgi:RHS repeat-associated protein
MKPYSSSDITSYPDYYPFGMQMPDRKGGQNDYRFAFNGIEKDDEVKGGSGNHMNFGARAYDSRLGRWFSPDPKEYEFPSWSPYNFAYNSPIAFSDPDGEKPKLEIIKKENGDIVIRITNTLFITNKGKEAKNNLIKSSDISQYLKGGKIKLDEKNISIEIINQVVNVKNKREGRRMIDNNKDFGVLVIRNSKRRGRSFHLESGYTRSGYDEIRLFKGETDAWTVAHEDGHDMGFADKYVDNIQAGRSRIMLPFLDGLMAVPNMSLNSFELLIIADDVLNTDTYKENGRVVNFEADRIPKGEIIEVIPFNNETKKFEINKPETLKVVNSEGTAKGVEVGKGSSSGGSRKSKEQPLKIESPRL